MVIFSLVTDEVGELLSFLGNLTSSPATVHPRCSTRGWRSAEEAAKGRAKGQHFGGAVAALQRSAD